VTTFRNEEFERRSPHSNGIQKLLLPTEVVILVDLPAGCISEAWQ